MDKLYDFINVLNGFFRTTWLLMTYFYSDWGFFSENKFVFPIVKSSW